MPSSNGASKVTSLTTRISLWARQGGVQTNVAYSGRVRTVIDNCCIALGWMSKGGLYDNRTLRKRLCAGNYYWKAAIRAAIRRAA